MWSLKTQLQEVTFTKQYCTTPLPSPSFHKQANSEVFNILLSILDDGRVTDSKGRTVNFANTVIILTSNLGSEALLQAAQKSRHHPLQHTGRGAAASTAVSTAVDPYHEAKQVVMAAVRRFFRPEFLNRLDDIVIFEPLQPHQIVKIAGLMGQELAARLVPRNIGLSFTDAALSYTVKHAYDPEYGARPLRRWMEHTIVTELSRMIVSGRLPENSDVLVDVDTALDDGATSERLVYTVTPKPVDASGVRGRGNAGVQSAAELLMKRARPEAQSMDLDQEDE